MVEIFAPAKINLFLEIIGKREDNYHILNSLVVFADIGDRLFIEEADNLSLNTYGSFAKILPEENILHKTAQVFKEYFALPCNFALTLEKNLPIAAGIGGGSADSAAFLRFLADYYQLSTREICSLIGADIEVCFFSKPSYLTSISDVTLCLRMPELDILLINPNIPLFTKEIFQNFRGKPVKASSLELDFSSKEAVISYIEDRENMLEDAAIELCPVIYDILEALRSCGSRIARMSGSGATCFAIFDQAEEANWAANKLKEQYPHYWIQVGKTYSQFMYSTD